MTNNERDAVLDALVTAAELGSRIGDAARSENRWNRRDWFKNLIDLGRMIGERDGRDAALRARKQRAKR